MKVFTMLMICVATILPTTALLAQSNTYDLSISDTELFTGETITVTWDVNADSISRDWIGLYETNANDRAFIDWEYVTDDNGSFIFTMEKTGSYEFRYFLQNGYDLAAESDVIVVTEEDDGGEGGETGYSLITDRATYDRDDIAQVTWNTPPNTNFFLNWIGIYELGTADSEYLGYEYVDILSRTETFRLDRDGVFEFRFFTNNSFDRVAISDPITVSNNTTASCQLNVEDIANYPPPNGPIIAFGDSLTLGVGASPGEDYVSELEDRLGITIINRGVSGDSTVDALERLEEDVLSSNPSAVIVFLGGNDEIRRFYEKLSNNLADRNLKDRLDALAIEIDYDWMNVPLIPRDETFDNIETIIERIQDTGATTILVGFEAAIFDTAIAADYRRIANNTNSFFVPDIYDGVFGRSRLMSDIVHPNDVGYDIFADRIQPAVACVLPDTQS